MLVMALMLVANLIVGPEPHGSPADWIDPDSYPRYPLGQTGTVNFRLLVSSYGKPQRCDITTGSGFAALDRLTCASLMGRSNFFPARDEKGDALFGVWRGAINWEKPGLSHKPVEEADYSMDVPAIPKAMKAPVLWAYLLVSANGSIENCAVKDTQGSHAFSADACSQLIANFRPAATVDLSNTAVRSVQNIRIELKVARKP